MIASGAFLGMRASTQFVYAVIASSVGSYFKPGASSVSLWVTREYVRASPGGTGEAKCGGNYAGSLVAQAEAIRNGCDQVVFLDAIERRWVEELGGMNLYFVHRDGSIVTPELTGTILEGVTRSSILQLAEELGHPVKERRISIDEWREGAASGDITEVFACGTAAVVTPVGRLAWDGGEALTGEDADGGVGPVTAGLRRALLDVQYGRTPDTHGWLTRLA
jgi:branched-chain amino acid aminotransferase